MKKSVAKIFASVIAAAMSVTMMASCGKTEVENPAKSNTEFFIGATGPLTGTAASYGISVNNGAKLAIKEINAAGGLNSVKFKFEMLDDANVGASAGTGYDTLYSKGMQASIGSVTTEPCKVFRDRAIDDNMFFITPSASAAEVISPSNGYRICFSDPDQGDKAAKYLKDAGYTKFGVVYQSDDTYSKGVYTQFATHFTTELTAESFTSSNKITFPTQVTALKNAGVEVVFLPVYYQEAYLIIQEAAKQGLSVKYLGSDGLDGLAGYAKENASLFKGVKYITPFDITSKDTVVSKFVTDFKAEFSSDPDQFAADGYDAIMVIYQAMKTADCKDATISASDLCNVITGVIQNGSFSYKGATGTMTWDANGAPQKSIAIVEIG